MLRESARFILAAVLTLTLCPAVAVAAEGDGVSGEPSNMMAQTNEVPAIRGVNAAAGSRTVVINGSGFGAQQGTSRVEVYVGGVTRGALIASAVTSWTDASVSVELAENPADIIDVVLITEGGTSQRSKLVGLSSDVFEDRLAAPDSGLGADYDGVLSSSSILKGCGNYLYYLSEVPVSAGSPNFAFSAFKRFHVDTGEWEALSSLPVWLAYASGCVWEDNFLVAGVAYDATAGAVTTQERVFMYNFERAAWQEINANGVPLGAGIVNLNGYLRVVGGANGSWAFADGVYEYDTSTGVGELVASLATPAFCPQLAVNDEKIFVYSYGDTIDQYNGAGARHLQVVDDDSTRMWNGSFPDFAAADVPAGMPARAEVFGSLAAGNEGLMLVGPAEAVGAYDTFILDWNWKNASFRPFHKRVSDARIYGASACIHDNRLYAAASSVVEPGHSVFRATKVVAPMVERGDYQVWRQGSKKPLTVVFTPDYSRYCDRVFVDDVRLDYGSEYTVEPGSTVVNLTARFLSTLSAEDHELLVYFDGYEDGPGSEVLAHFTVEGKADPAPVPATETHGYTRPAALAMTGDMLLVVPFAVLGIGALAIGIYLVRRKIRNG